jgi:hypothetical protein
MRRSTALMLDWLAAHEADELAAATASFYPDVPPDVLAEALGRYRAAGIWAATPAMSRAGFIRLAESFVSGGSLAGMPRYEDCVALDLA